MVVTFCTTVCGSSVKIIKEYKYLGTIFSEEWILRKCHHRISLFKKLKLNFSPSNNILLTFYQRWRLAILLKSQKPKTLDLPWNAFVQPALAATTKSKRWRRRKTHLELCDLLLNLGTLPSFRLQTNEWQLAVCCIKITDADSTMSNFISHLKSHPRGQSLGSYRQFSNQLVMSVVGGLYLHC